MIEQEPISNRFESLGEGHYQANGGIIITAVYFKPFSSHADAQLSIGDFYDPYLIKINNDFGFFRNFDPGNSKLVISGANLVQNVELPVTKTEYQGSTYVGVANFDSTEWLDTTPDGSISLMLHLSISGSLFPIDLGNLTPSKDEIYTWRDLQGMKEKLDGEYQLMNPILFPQPGTEGFPANGFEPVGSEANPFTGSLDGNSKIISKLYIDRPEQNHVGLFGVIDNDDDIETVKRLTIVYKKILGQHSVGSLAGLLTQGKVNHIRTINYFNNSKVKGMWNVGGIIGICSTSGIINNAINQGNINGKSHVGG